MGYLVHPNALQNLVAHTKGCHSDEPSQDPRFQTPRKGKRCAEGAVFDLWGFRVHSELALSALLKAVTACFRSRCVGSASHRFFDRLRLLKRAPPRSGAASSYFTRADSVEWAQGHERAKSTYPDKPTRLCRAGAQPIGRPLLPRRRGSLLPARQLRGVFL